MAQFHLCKVRTLAEEKKHINTNFLRTHIHMGQKSEIKWLPGNRKGNESGEWRIKDRVFQLAIVP